MVLEVTASTFRALGVENGLHTSWESPLRYHRYNDTPVSMLPLNPAAWRRRLLDSRFMAVAGADGSLARLLNLGHVEARADVENQLLGVGLPEANIGSGVLPWHWWIKDRLAAFSMSVAQARSRSPLLLIGESDLKWDEYYGTLGHFREAGLCLGGGVSIALLDKLDPRQLPGLVWCPAARVDGAALKAIERHLRAGVPMLILGKLPQTLGEGPDLASLIGLAPADVAKSEAKGEAKGAAQELLGPAVTWPEGAGGEAGPGSEFLAPPAFAAVAPAETLVSRQGRSLVAWRREGIKAGFYGLVLQPWRKDDPLPRRIAVRAFRELMEGAPMSTPGSSAQVFTGLDGRTWAVLLNHEQRATTAILRLPGAEGPAVEMVGGRPLVAKVEAGALVVEVPLGPGDAALIAVGTAR